MTSRSPWTARLWTKPFSPSHLLCPPAIATNHSYPLVNVGLRSMICVSFIIFVLYYIIRFIFECLVGTTMLAWRAQVCYCIEQLVGSVIILLSWSVFSRTAFNLVVPILDGQKDSFLDAEKRLKGGMFTTLAHTVLICSDTLVNSKIWRVSA